MNTFSVAVNLMIECIESFKNYINPVFEKYDNNGVKLNYFDKRKDGVRIVHDKNTGLYWEVKSENKNDVNYYNDKYNFDEALNLYINKLNNSNYGGFNDWRIPNKDELRSILDYSNDCNIAVDLDIFENCMIGDYWTKNTYTMQPYFAWVIYLGFGSGIAKSKKTKRFVIACRGGHNKMFGEADNKRFIDNDDGTITDTVTKLMWQKDENERMDLKGAKDYCSKMNLAGYSDWRLPNIKELNTILNLNYNNNWWYFKDIFPAKGLNPPLLHYFSSSSFKEDYAWVTNFCFGYDGYYGSKNSFLLFRACRNIENRQEKNEFNLPHTGQLSAFDVEGNLTDSLEYDGLDSKRITNKMDFDIVCSGNAVKDKNTNLMWYIGTNNNCNVTWEDSFRYIENLNKISCCGCNDWRLPCREELRTIVDYNDIVPSVNTNIFKNINAEFFWSIEENKVEKHKAWGIYFGYGCAISYPKDIKASVIAVRGNNIYNTPFEKRFIDNSDGTITDSKTGLMWVKDETPLLNLKEAILYCSELKIGGFDDWSLSNIKELGTIINLNKDSEWYYKELFPNTNTKPQGFYLSSTTFDGTFGWGCNFQFGFDGYYADRKNGKYPFRPVRKVR